MAELSPSPRITDVPHVVESVANHNCQPLFLRGRNTCFRRASMSA